jgi:hypothetical protein
MSLELTGDWQAALKEIENGAQKLEGEIEKATIKNGELLVKTIVGHFQNQDLGWAPHKERTRKRRQSRDRRKISKVSRGEIRRRLQAMGISHSPKEKTSELRNRLAFNSHNMILVDTGTLMSSIQFRQVSWGEGFVGVSKGRATKGGDIANVALAHEFGTKHVPARPFIDPSVREKEKEIIKNFEEAIERVFKS